MKEAAQKYTQDWFSQNVPVLAELLSQFIDTRINMLEIGCFEGHSTLWFAENILTHHASKINCIDTFKGSPEHKTPGGKTKGIFQRFCANISAYKDKVIFYVGKSLEILKTLDEVFQIIYIDASHSQVDVLQDAVLSWPLLDHDGVMIFDDYGFFDPKNIIRPAVAMEAFCQVYENELEMLHVGHLVAVRKK